MHFFRRTKPRIYLDYASAPPVLPEAHEAMRAVEHLFGNPGAIHKEAVQAAQSLEDSRARIAALLSVKPRELVFTSGLTEANNLAILGFARELQKKGTDLSTTHWVVSSIEHASILECFSEVERMGGHVSYVDPLPTGVITAELLQRALRSNTVFVSIGWANNEIGTVQPLSDIARVIRAHEAAHDSLVLLHSDAGQAPLYRSTTAHSLGVDLLSIGANKLYGPHGIGVLHINNRVELSSHIVGGRQERALRAGTESVALAAGFAAAYETVARERDAEAKRLGSLRDSLKESLLRSVPGLIVNGDTDRALPHMLNVSILGIQSEYLTLALDAAGIAVSTKSACREGEEAESHVVHALGSTTAVSSAERASHTIRISLGRDTTEAEMSRVAEQISTLVKKYRVQEEE